MTETKTVDITPVFNEARIREYAKKHDTRDPQSHVQARLEVLSELSDLIDADAEREEGESITFETLVWEIQRRHRATTNEFLGFFGDPDDAAEPDAVPEFRSGPSDEVLVALAKREYASEDIEVDTNAVVNRGEDPGAFVAAWVWVAFPEES